MAFYDTWNTVFPQYDFRCDDASGGLNNSGTGADLSEEIDTGSITYSQTGPSSVGGSSIALASIASFKNATQLWFQTATTGTLAFIFKSSSATTQGLFSTNVPGTDGRRFEFRLQSNGSIWMRCYNTSGGTNSMSVTSTTTSYNDGEFHLLVIRQKADGTGVEMFVDNTTDVAGTPSLSGTFDADSWSNDVFGSTNYGTGDETNLLIDGHNNNNSFVGNIASFGLDDSAISDANLALLMGDFTSVFANKTQRRKGRRLYSDQL